MKMMMAEKVLARASGRETVKPGEFVVATVDTLMVADMSFYDSYEPMIAHGCSKIWDPDRMVVREVWKGVINKKIWHLKLAPGWRQKF